LLALIETSTSAAAVAAAVIHDLYSQLKRVVQWVGAVDRAMESLYGGKTSALTGDAEPDAADALDETKADHSNNSSILANPAAPFAASKISRIHTQVTSVCSIVSSSNAAVPPPSLILPLPSKEERCKNQQLLRLLHQQTSVFFTQVRESGLIHQRLVALLTTTNTPEEHKTAEQFIFLCWTRCVYVCIIKCSYVYVK
jgi:hypothetical protein